MSRYAEEEGGIIEALHDGSRRRDHAITHHQLLLGIDGDVRSIVDDPDLHSLRGFSDRKRASGVSEISHLAEGGRPFRSQKRIDGFLLQKRSARIQHPMKIPEVPKRALAR